jgi:two-component system sensor histidine kinase KdpD
MMSGRGVLHVILGMAPGTGKTYAMLAEAKRLADAGADVAVGWVETHGRADTQSMLDSLTVIPPRPVEYRGTTFGELDVDHILELCPTFVLVDELAHTCVPGSRHEKRWEDIEELLAAGINVVTSLNVQHLDSLNDAVESLTGFAQRETVPDAVVAAADRIDFIDVSPEELRARIAGSDVLASDTTRIALGGFYTAERLGVLRGLALAWLRDHGRGEVAPPSSMSPTAPSSLPPERVLVALAAASEGEHVLRRAARIASSARAELVGVHVRVPSDEVGAEPTWLVRQRQLLGELGGRYSELAGIDVANAVLDFARREGANELVLGATRRSRVYELLHGSVINKAIRAAGPVEVHVVPARRLAEHIGPAELPRLPLHRPVLPGPRRVVAWLLSVVAPGVITIGLIPVRSSLGLAGALLCSLVAVVGVVLLGGVFPAVVATAVAVALSDFYYTAPLHSFRVAHLVDVIALITFGVVAAAVGGLVDLLARRGVQVVRANTEAQNLARFAADLIVAPDDLSEAVRSIRHTFDLDGVVLLRRTARNWEVEAATGDDSVQIPSDAPCSVEIAQDRVLAFPHSRLAEERDTLFGTFLAQLRLARERVMIHGR